MNRLRSLALSLLFAFALASVAHAQTGSAAKTAKTAPHSGAPAAAAGPQFDINSASATELKSVPGIGDAYAAKIIAGRPYKSKAQLKSRKILPAAVYDKASPSLIAKQK